MGMEKENWEEILAEIQCDQWREEHAFRRPVSMMEQFLGIDIIAEDGL